MITKYEAKTYLVQLGSDDAGPRRQASVHAKQHARRPSRPLARRKGRGGRGEGEELVEKEEGEKEENLDMIIQMIWLHQ